MPSRQDQLHSYQFMLQRVVSALVMRETDPAQSPFRRIAGAALVGVLLAALGIGGAAAFGVISPGGSGKWRDDRAIIVEKESGALYVYRDRRLHPVLNHASALLILKTTGARTVSVSRRSIAKAPRGVTLGIPGAPPSLPTRGGLYRGEWTVCSASPEESVLFVGDPPDGGTVLADRGLLVSTVDGTAYLLWRRHKHLVRDPQTVLAVLLWSGRPVPKVAPALLNALPSGTDLARIPVRGQVLQVYAVARDDGTPEHYFVRTPGGLASLTSLQAALILADPDAANLGPVIRLRPPEFAALVQGQTVRPFAPDPGAEGALPADVPPLLDGSPAALCVTGARVSYGVSMPDLSTAVPTRARATGGAVLADRIVVPPGGGALVQADTGGVVLVTDQGRRFPLASPELVPVLGYGGVAPVPVPAGVVALVPAGPVLDPAVAASPVDG